MGVSCEDYNQCQLTQPDLTPHTVRRNIFPSHAHIQTHVCTSCTHTLSFSICLSFSRFLSVSVSHPRFHSLFLPLSHANTHRWMLGTITVSDQAHRHRGVGGDWTKRLSLHIQCVECVLLSPTRGWQDLCLSMWQWMWFPVKCVYVCVWVCVVPFYIH